MSNKRTLADAGMVEQRPRRHPATLEPEAEDSPTSTDPVLCPAEDRDEEEDLSTGITGHEAIRTPRVSGRTVEELEDEIESLESVVDRLDEEKHALRTRLNEIDYFKKFDVADCKRWLTSNFEFDRKDTPDLLAGIFENYLMQQDAFEPLPHQLLVKNSTRAQTKRDKSTLSRSSLHVKKEKDRVSGVEIKLKNPPPPRPTRPATGDAGVYGQYLYVAAQAIDDLYAAKPWAFLIEKWPKIQPTSKTTAIEPLVQAQDDFLVRNEVAIWERTHWFPIKQEHGKTPQEVIHLGRHHNRRKRRQAQLKERLEALAAEMIPHYEKALLQQSIFGSRWVAIILKRPNLWLPRENESLIDQLVEIDDLEPDRNYNLMD